MANFTPISALIGGALIGALAGVPGTCAAIGAAAGASVGGAGGYIVDQVDQRQAAQAENTQLRQENEQLRQEQQQTPATTPSTTTN